MQPPYYYVQMATVMSEPPILDFFHLRTVATTFGTGMSTPTVMAIPLGVWSKTLSATVSHAHPMASRLRLFKRAGRPELSERYARIRKRIAAQRAND